MQDLRAVGRDAQRGSEMTEPVNRHCVPPRDASPSPARAATAPHRTNDEWLAHLQATPPQSDAAYADLGRLLRGALRKALAARRAVDDAAIDDFAQEALIRIRERLDTFRGDSRFTTWACAVTIRVALSSLRRAHWRDLPMDEAERRLFETRGDSPERAAHRDRVVAAHRRPIAPDQNPRHPETLVAELTGTPQAVLCERLGTNRNALYKLTHDARQRLRAGLEADGITADDVRALFDTTSDE